MRPYLFARLLSMLVILLLATASISACSTAAPQAVVAELPETDAKNTPANDSPAQKPTAQATRESEPTAVPPTPTPQLLPLVFSDPLIWQSDESGVQYVFEVENPNQDFGIENGQFSASFLDADGKEIWVEPDEFLPSILPGQKLWVAEDVFSNEIGKVAKMQLTPTNATPIARTDLQQIIDNPLTVEQVKIIQMSYDNKYATVTGIVINALNTDLDSSSVVLIAYDAGGSVIGGGDAYVQFLLPNDSSAFRGSILISGEVDRIEAYPAARSFRDMLTMDEVPDGASPPVVEKSDYAINRRGSVDVALLLFNPNTQHEIYENIMWIAYAKDGSVLEVYQDYITLSPNAITGITRSMFLPMDAELDRIEYKLYESSYSEAEPNPVFTYTIKSIAPGSGGFVVTGEVSNPTAEEITSLFVHAIAYDQAGEIIGVNRVVIESLPANETVTVQPQFDLSAEPAKVEFYIDYNP